MKIELDLGTKFIGSLSTDIQLKGANIPGGGDLVDAIGQGAIAASMHGNLTLDLGIDLTDAAAPRPFLYDSTSASIDASLSSSALNFSAALGPLGISIENGSVTTFSTPNNPGSATLKVALAHSNDEGRYYLDTGTFSLADFQAPPRGGGSLVATLSIFLGSTALGSLFKRVDRQRQRHDSRSRCPRHSGVLSGQCIRS